MKTLWNLKALTFDQEPWQKRIFPQHHWLLKKIQAISPQSILEIGCGFGRNINFLIKNNIKPNQITGVDFSLIMLLKAKKNLDHQVILKKASVQKLPFKVNQFDLTFTHGVLMHLQPQDLNLALDQLIKVSKKHLILIEETRNQPQQLNNFTWAHDYEKILKNKKLKILERKIDKNLNLTCWLLKKSNTNTRETSTPRN